MLAILMGLVFWGLVLYGVCRLIRAMFSKNSLQSVLLRKKLINKEQYAQIESFEIQAKIEQWRKYSLISDEQADAILNPPVKQKQSIIQSLLYLGVGCVMLGIIAVIAANYDKIPPMVRLMSVFTFFVGCNIGAFISMEKNKPLVKDAFLLSSAALIGALIGLVSQTFHLTGSVENALFMWSALALPFVVLMSKGLCYIGACVWYPVFTLTFFVSDYGRHFLRFLENHFSLAIVFIAAMFLLLTLFDVMKKKIPNHAFTIALDVWLKIYAVGALILLDSIYVTSDLYALLPIKTMPCNLALVALTMIYPLINIKKARLALIFLVCFAFVASLFIAPFMGIVLTLGILSFVAVYAARQNEMKLFNVAILCFFGRIVFAYVNLFMSLLSTGISAIILGVLILLGLKFWTTYKVGLINYLQKGK